MKDTTIAFIGGGNMARSLIGGLIAGGCSPPSIWVADPDRQHLRAIRDDFGVQTRSSNAAVLRHAEVVVLAVKPQVMKAVAQELAPAVKSHRPLIVSVAAGIRASHLAAWLGPDIAIVRAMPNTPALVRAGVTALYATSTVSAPQRGAAESILRAAGMTVWVQDEGMMDAVTAVSGSGPAYFFLVMECMERAAQELGLPHETARLLTLQTAFGAAKMALESAEELTALRTRVTSPGGTTEQALKVLTEGKLEELFKRALQAAHRRSVELAAMFGET